MLICGIFTCVLITCPKGPNPGPRNEVAGDLVMKSALLFMHITARLSVNGKRVPLTAVSVQPAGSEYGKEAPPTYTKPHGNQFQ